MARIAVNAAGPATRSMIPGITRSSIGSVISTGSFAAHAEMRAARCTRSPSAMFFIDWVSGVP